MIRFFRGHHTLTTSQLGRRGERVAARAMRRAGCRILHRNYHIAGGEIDLICFDPAENAVVFVEVKSLRYRRPEDALVFRPEGHVNGPKRRQLVRLAAAAARREGWRERRRRIDIVAVEFHAHRRRPVVRRLQDVIRFR